MWWLCFLHRYYSIYNLKIVCGKVWSFSLTTFFLIALKIKCIQFLFVRFGFQSDIVWFFRRRIFSVFPCTYYINASWRSIGSSWTLWSSSVESLGILVGDHLAPAKIPMRYNRNLSIMFDLFIQKQFRYFFIDIWISSCRDSTFILLDH